MQRSSIALFLATAGLLAASTGCSKPSEAPMAPEKPSLTAPATPGAGETPAHDKKKGAHGEGGEGGEG